MFRVELAFVQAPATGARGGGGAVESGGKSVGCSVAGDWRSSPVLRPRGALSWCLEEPSGRRPIAQSGRAGNGCFDDVDVEVNVLADDEEVDDDWNVLAS